jgi:hypothetical protein
MNLLLIIRQLINGTTIALLTSCLYFAFMPRTAFSRDAEPVAVVYKLYKNYGWTALFYDADDKNASRFLGKPVTQQPKNILVRYFDENLAALLLRDANCVKNNPGIECKLGFDPIFASQDVAAYDLKITDAGEGKVNVEYTYPSTHEKVKLLFFTKKVKNEWRISDIHYSDGPYLTQILDIRNDDENRISEAKRAKRSPAHRAPDSPDFPNRRH